MNHVKISLLLITLCVFGCKSDDDITTPITENPTVDNTDNEVETSISTGDEQYLNLDSDYIFDQNTLHTFELNLPESALAQIDADPAAEEYVEGSLTFEGETISPVGIRYKGSIGAFVNCVSGIDWANPSGRKICTKLSMKVKINWEGREEKFYKLKKLQFHSMNNDPTQMRERLGYWLFAEMGVPTPRCVHARLLINGTYVGLFALVEQIDGRFARYHFDDGTGNIYKEIWPLNYNNQAHSEADYIQALKTNEDEAPTAEIIRTFAQEVVAAGETDLPNVIANTMDIDEILSYAVVDRTIRHDDGPFHWYCSGGGCENHNYYWYEEPTEKSLHLIPWDLDHAFINIINDTNPVTAVADDWGEISGNCAPFAHGWLGWRQRSAACDKLTGGWASFEQEYAELKSKLVTGPLSEAVVSARLEAWTAQVRAATVEAREAHGDAISVQQWEAAMGTLRSQVNYAREH